MEPSIVRKNGLISVSFGVGSSNNSSANVTELCRRRFEAFLSTL